MFVIKYIITEWIAKQEQPCSDVPAPDPSPQLSPTIGGDEFLLMVLDWLKLATYREKRRFLEAHPGLLNTRTGHLLATIGQHANTKEASQVLYDHLKLLHDTLDRGSSLTAIREAYVDMYGGFVLDLPPWLEVAEQQLAQLNREGLSGHRLTEYLNLLRDAMRPPHNMLALPQS